MTKFVKHFFRFCLLLVVVGALYNDLVFPLYFSNSSKEAKWLTLELIVSQQEAENEHIGRYMAENKVSKNFCNKFKL